MTCEKCGGDEGTPTRSFEECQQAFAQRVLILSDGSMDGDNLDAAVVKAAHEYIEEAYAILKIK